MTEDIEPITLGTFVIGMMQAKHNKENPNHKCECKSIEEMVSKHFDIHKKKELEK